MTNVGEGNLDSGVNDVDAKPHITDGVVADSPSSIQKPLQDPQAQSVPKTQGLEASPAISDCRSLSESSSLTASPEMERNRILQELMETERKYVRDLETMQDYAIDLGIEEILDQDTIHGLFPNLDNIVKFQTEFLAVLESIYAQPWEEQCWGMAFIHKEKGFRVYEPYCAYYNNAMEILQIETPYLTTKATTIEPRSELPALLIKPVQRICHYTPILESLAVNVSNSNYPYLRELHKGISAMKRVLSGINRAQREVENQNAIEALRERVVDWKGHRLENFGSLILHDILMVKREEVNRSYQVFLFENILIICKESTGHDKEKKSKGLTSILRGGSGVASRANSATAAPVAGKNTTRLLLKGRVFLRSLNVGHTGESDLSLHLWWKEGDGLECFDMNYGSRERMKEWEVVLRKLIKEAQPRLEKGRTALLNQTQEPLYPAIEPMSDSEEDMV